MESNVLQLVKMILYLYHNLLNPLYPQEEKARALHELDAPTGFKLEAILPVGHSDEESPKTSRRELSETVFVNKWGNPTPLNCARATISYGNKTHSS